MDRILHMITLGRVTLTDEAGPIALVQVDQGAIGAGTSRVRDKVKRFCQFGFASVPPLGSEVVMVAQGGLISRLIALATNHQSTRPKDMKPGSSRIYDVRGAMIDLSDTGMVIDAAGLAVTIRNYSTLTAEGDLHVTGDVISRSNGTPVSLNRLRDAYDQHKHLMVKAGTDTSGTTDHPV